MGRAGVPGSNHVLREKPITAGRRIESCIKKKKKRHLIIELSITLVIGRSKTCRNDIWVGPGSRAPKRARSGGALLRRVGLYIEF